MIRQVGPGPVHGLLQVGPFLGVGFSLMAVQNAKAGVAATLMSITPVLLLAPAAFLMKERITPRAVVGAVVAVGGVALLVHR